MDGNCYLKGNNSPYQHSVISSINEYGAQLNFIPLQEQKRQYEHFPSFIPEKNTEPFQNDSYSNRNTDSSYRCSSNDTHSHVQNFPGNVFHENNILNGCLINYQPEVVNIQNLNPSANDDSVLCISTNVHDQRNRISYHNMINNQINSLQEQFQHYSLKQQLTLSNQNGASTETIERDTEAITLQNSSSGKQRTARIVRDRWKTVGPLSDEKIGLPEVLRNMAITNEFPRKKGKWNTNEEMLALLRNYSKHEEWQSTDVIIRPESGTMLMYSRKRVRYRRDGYCWKKRKDGKTTREDHMKLKVHGIECIYGCYVHSAILPTFHRRCYWLLKNPDLVLVHYLNLPCQEGGKITSFIPNIAFWTEKKEWTKEELHYQLQPMFKNPNLDDDTKSLSEAQRILREKRLYSYIENIVIQLLEKQTVLRKLFMNSILECGCKESPKCKALETCRNLIRHALPTIKKISRRATNTKPSLKRISKTKRAPKNINKSYRTVSGNYNHSADYNVFSNSVQSAQSPQYHRIINQQNFQEPAFQLNEPKNLPQSTQSSQHIGMFLPQLHNNSHLEQQQPRNLTCYVQKPQHLGMLIQQSPHSSQFHLQRSNSISQFQLQSTTQQSNVSQVPFLFAEKDTYSSSTQTVKDLQPVTSIVEINKHYQSNTSFLNNIEQAHTKAEIYSNQGIYTQQLTPEDTNFLSSNETTESNIQLVPDIYGSSGWPMTSYANETGLCDGEHADDLNSIPMPEHNDNVGMIQEKLKNMDIYHIENENSSQSLSTFQLPAFSSNFGNGKNDNLDMVPRIVIEVVNKEDPSSDVTFSYNNVLLDNQTRNSYSSNAVENGSVESYSDSSFSTLTTTTDEGIGNLSDTIPLDLENVDISSFDTDYSDSDIYNMTSLSSMEYSPASQNPSPGCCSVSSGQQTTIYGTTMNQQSPIQSCVIAAYAPEWAYSDGGTAMLIIGKWCNYETSYMVLFDDHPVPAVLIQDGVLKCICPEHNVGFVPLRILCGNCISGPVLFEFKEKPSNVDDSYKVYNKFLFQNDTLLKCVLIQQIQRNVTYLNF